MFFALLFLSLAVVFSLIAPQGDFLRSAGGTLTTYTGFLAVFIPAGLFLAGSAVLGLSFAKRWLAATGSIFICSFFLSALLAMILGRSARISFTSPEVNSPEGPFWLPRPLWEE